MLLQVRYMLLKTSLAVQYYLYIFILDKTNENYKNLPPYYLVLLIQF